MPSQQPALESVAAVSQGELALERPSAGLLLAGTELEGLDLFCGMGGLSSGFAALGFRMLGIDSEPVATEVYQQSGFGNARLLDLGSEVVSRENPLVVGGPPCRPWSPMNLQRRGTTHSDHRFLQRFMAHIDIVRPKIFVMENVPAVRSDPEYESGLKHLRDLGYSIAVQVLRYDDFGAATRRRRAFTVGLLKRTGGAEAFFRLLAGQRTEASTVREAIARYRDIQLGGFPDHDWPNLKTIHKYSDRYASGQYGWRKLTYDSAAPSFGSVAKTYILHPEAGIAGFPERVLSVREVMAITGFSDQVRFPAGTSRTKRYQLVANSVSPQCSLAIAKTVKAFLRGF